ncbi:hypothetical protein [Teredinibacter turnerae]|uniref:hypothetical protein n=1 Tax=Teredinibacter turnerae TaxID=2426 RepID=UPI0018AD40E0|nr:hypothetical protein [Teredinibacter turnerae]
MFRDEPWPGSILSNFASTPFEIEGVSCSCSESFIQSLKCEDIDEQRKFVSLSGQEAWESGSKLTDYIFRKRKIWWLGKAMELHSLEHFALVKRGLYAKFSQSTVAREALLESGDAILTHEYGQKPGQNQSLPVEVFCQIVTDIRTQIKNEKNS